LPRGARKSIQKNKTKNSVSQLYKLDERGAHAAVTVAGPAPLDRRVYEALVSGAAGDFRGHLAPEAT